MQNVVQKYPKLFIIYPIFRVNAIKRNPLKAFFFSFEYQLNGHFIIFISKMLVQMEQRELSA